MDNADFTIAGLSQSRNLYSTEEGLSLDKDEPVTIKYYYDGKFEPENLMLRVNELFETDIIRHPIVKKIINAYKRI